MKDENEDTQLSCKDCLLCGGACGMTVSGRPPEGETTNE